MKTCSYSDFLTILKNSTHSLPREFIILATKNIECRVAFFVYLLLLDLSMQPNVQTHTVCIAQREMAEYLNVSLRTIKRAIAFLKKSGYITIARDNPGKGGYQLNQIQVLFPEPFVYTILQKMNLDYPHQNILELQAETHELHPISLIQQENP